MNELPRELWFYSIIAENFEGDSFPYQWMNAFAQTSMTTSVTYNFSSHYCHLLDLLVEKTTRIISMVLVGFTCMYVGFKFIKYTLMILLSLSDRSALCFALISLISSSNMAFSFSRSVICSSAMDRANSSDSAFAKASSSCAESESLSSCRIWRSPCNACTCFDLSSTSSFNSRTWVLYNV